MKIAQVCFYKDRSKFLDDKKYSYFTDMEDLDWEDEVVVETRYGNKVAVFMHYVEEDSKEAERASAWVIQKVDMNGLESKKAKQKKLKEVRVKLLERKAKIQEKQMFEMLAKNDPTMADLLKEYESLL